MFDQIKRNEQVGIHVDSIDSSVKDLKAIEFAG